MGHVDLLLVVNILSGIFKVCDLQRMRLQGMQIRGKDSFHLFESLASGREKLKKHGLL